MFKSVLTCLRGPIWRRGRSADRVWFARRPGEHVSAAPMRHAPSIVTLNKSHRRDGGRSYNIDQGSNAPIPSSVTFYPRHSCSVYHTTSGTGIWMLGKGAHPPWRVPCAFKCRGSTLNENLTRPTSASINTSLPRAVVSYPFWRLGCSNHSLFKKEAMLQKQEL